jgi:hypothetical protein
MTWAGGRWAQAVWKCIAAILPARGSGAGGSSDVRSGRAVADLTAPHLLRDIWT